jgi:hypothetical protein
MRRVREVIAAATSIRGEERVIFEECVALHDSPIELVFSVVPVFAFDMAPVTTARDLHARNSFFMVQLKISQKVSYASKAIVACVIAGY